MENECEQCGGEMLPMGLLGRRLHLKCRQCGIQYSRELSSEELAALADQEGEDEE